MPFFFKCKVSRTVFTDDLKTTRVKEDVYVEAKDESDAKRKAANPANWVKSAGTFGKTDKSSSFLLTVEECKRVAKEEVKDIRPGDPACAPTQSHRSSSWGEHDDGPRA
jgi:hypothetical protein